eukprot:274105-Prymnesium_polylepis.2
MARNSLVLSASAKDPHVSFCGGGEADFRGRDRTVFSFVSAPNIQVNLLTEDRSFVSFAPQLVHGSFITRVFIKAKSATTGQVLRAAVLAEEWASFRLCTAEEESASGIDPMQPACEKKTRMELTDVKIMQMSGGRLFAHAAGWEVFVQRHRVMKPMVNGTEVPINDRARSFLRVAFRVLDGDPKLVGKVGRSTVGRIAPHGIVGQSCDGSNITVSGRTDDYGDTPEFTTGAQAEGAIEGDYTDYITAGPFATAFKYARFDAINPVGPRNVSRLAGSKSLASVRMTPGSSRLQKRKKRASAAATRGARRRGVIPSSLLHHGLRDPLTPKGNRSAVAKDIHQPVDGVYDRCAYTVVASRKYFAALIVLLHSLFRHNDEANDPECEAIVIIWSPQCSDSNLSVSERNTVECLAGKRRVRWVVANQHRLTIWGGVRLPIQIPGACLLMSLEMFYLNVSSALVHFDLDMLVLKPLSFVAAEVIGDVRMTALHRKKLLDVGWLLHGHCQTLSRRGGCPLHIQLGFSAFRTPVIASFRHELLETSITWAQQGRIAANGDQDMVNRAIEVLDARIPRRLPALAKKVAQGEKLRPRQLWLHRDWNTNYRPYTASDLRAWRVLHWQSIAKPWQVGPSSCTFGRCGDGGALE